MNWKPLFLTQNQLLVFLAVCAIVLIVFYRYVYGREARHARRLTGRQVFGLWCLRASVAVLALLALARPAVRVQEERRRLPVVPIIVDNSASMDFPTWRNNPLVAGSPRRYRTRFDAAQNAVRRLVDHLSLTHRVKVYAGSDILRLLREVPFRKSPDDPLPSREELFPPDAADRKHDAKYLRAKGQYSNLYDCIARALAENSAHRISGVIVVSDFQRTGGKTLKEIVAAATAAEKPEDRVPIFPCVEGTEYPLRDLRIDEVFVPTEANLGDVLTFRLKITNDIGPGITPELTLLENGQEIRKKTLRGRDLHGLRRGENDCFIATIPRHEGVREFRLRLPVDPNEVNKQNNEAVVKVKIVKRTLNVLLIAGKPSREYFYMVPALLRDPVIRLSCYLQAADVDYIQQGNANIDRLPKTLKEWQEFDVAILYDIDPNGISAPQIAGLENMVNKGGGLVFIAGRNYGLAKLIQVHALRIRGLLPVEIDKNQYPDYDRYFPHSFAARRTPEGRGHPILFASGDEKLNEELWRRFPRFYWQHPVIEVKRQAVVLLERAPEPSRPRPEAGTCLMATMRYGEGRVFFSAVDSMWRWRYPYESYDYDRFWTRVVRYLGEARLPGAKQAQVALRTDRRTYSPGETVHITLRILDYALMKQIADEPVFASITSPKKDQRIVRLRPRPSGEPVYEGTYRARTVGSMELRVRQIAPGADTQQKPLFDVAHVFQVQMQSLEKKDTRADLRAARELARDTGGKCFSYKNIRSVEDLDKLAASLSTEKQILVHPVTLEVWDSVYFLVLFLVLISAEWSLRKWWGLL